MPLKNHKKNVGFHCIFSNARSERRFERRSKREHGKRCDFEVPGSEKVDFGHDFRTPFGTQNGLGGVRVDYKIVKKTLVLCVFLRLGSLGGGSGSVIKRVGKERRPYVN